MLRHNTYTKRDHGKCLYYITQSIVLELKIRLLLEQNPEEIKTGHYFNLSLTYITTSMETLKTYTFIKTIP